MTTIEGEKINTSQELADIGATNQPIEIFNPLDAEPVAFKRQLTSRSDNYDSLALHLRNMLVPDKDFGRIHVVNKNKCQERWRCSYQQNPGHWSPHTLLAAGADKVLGMLGLGVHYPNEQDFIRAALTGKQINDVIMKCHILGHSDQVIAEGMGACSRDEVQGSLNNAIKRACKRARLDAVLRLPSISALFEDDFLASVAREAAKNNNNSTTGRQQRPRTQEFNTGARLEVMPVGKKLKGQRFRDMEDGALEYILKGFEDKPDIWKAAKRELDRRHPAGDITPEKSPKSTENAGNDTGDWLSDYDQYESMHGSGARAEDRQ